MLLGGDTAPVEAGDLVVGLVAEAAGVDSLEEVDGA